MAEVLTPSLESSLEWTTRGPGASCGLCRVGVWSSASRGEGVAWWLVRVSWWGRVPWLCAQRWRASRLSAGVRLGWSGPGTPEGRGRSLRDWGPCPVRFLFPCPLGGGRDLPLRSCGGGLLRLWMVVCRGGAAGLDGCSVCRASGGVATCPH